jgi:hypothetical protein
MVEYSFDEAIELLEKNLNDARKKLKQVRDCHVIVCYALEPASNNPP